MKRAKILLIVLFLVLSAGGVFYWQYLLHRAPAPSPSVSSTSPSGPAIVSGGVGSASIPAINDPKFESVVAADQYLKNDGEGLSVAVGSKHRFYPYQLLVWHQIVNETFAGQSLLVSYSPLTDSGLVYERTLGDAGDAPVFAVSGQLLDNNLLMQDAKSQSLWSQATGKAVQGSLTGSSLTPYPADVMSWQSFKDNFSTGEVLSRDTGATRDYTRDPYQLYEQSKDIWFPLNHTDARIDAKTVVYGLAVGGATKAYPLKTIMADKTITDTIGATGVTIVYDAKLQTVRASVTDTKDPILAEEFYWFSWAATYPDTDLYAPEAQK